MQRAVPRSLSTWLYAPASCRAELSVTTWLQCDHVVTRRQARQAHRQSNAGGHGFLTWVAVLATTTSFRG